METAPPSALDPFLLAKIQNLQLRARTVAEGVLAGMHKSPMPGHSLEFAEHREYVSGDELRALDWKVYGRTDRFFVRQYEQESNLRIVLVLDGSGSMAFRGTDQPLAKYDYAATICAALMYLGLKQGESVGVCLLQEERTRLVPARPAFPHLHVLLKEVESAKPEGATVLAAGLEELALSLKRRSLIAVVSDLLEDEQALVRSLKRLRFKKHDVAVLHLLDPDEKEFPYHGPVELRSLESEERIVLDGDAYGAEYRGALARTLERLRLELQDSGILYQFHTTGESPDRVLRNFIGSA